MVYANYLAPIDEYTNLPFRLLCQKYNACATCAPLVNSTAIARGEKIGRVDAHRDETNIGIQLVGNNPADIGRSMEILAEKMPFVSWFNLNCGCPSVRTRDSGGGGALLDQPEIIEKLIGEMKKHTKKPVSVKIRLKHSIKETVVLCKKIEAAGVNFIIIHGRTVKQGYSGKCNWNEIKMINEQLEVPVVGNGDIQSLEQGNGLVKEGYCDSFMIGRAAMTNPMIFAGKQPDDLKDRIKLLKDYQKLYEKYVGTVETGDMKLKAVNFVSSVAKASELRNKICRANSASMVLDILEKQN
ncbi:tRNA-dihydrouridine synthase B [Candidatus Bilamarchaeum dharawalense]|uniref:tRNA-dihydrouridine synthase B n=1 Tax=Candidatus Bilamarchaeum dharawalense TaxID=2885759 RepID=A0A5E4LML1_9ARCH|nr:tRNA-dihydrouridine synthase B [Candidatus Bilamarchaeum dharawalense]